MAISTDEMPLKAMWDEASEEFRKRTGKSLRKPVSLDSALSVLNTKLNPSDPETGEKQNKVKSAATNIVKLIQLLGGLAAQGASIVFGPADMCFNALQFLLDIPSKINKVWDDLAMLLEDVSAFMNQFKIYQDIEKITALDAEFRQSVHKLLLAFVDICGIAFKVCDKRASSMFKRISKTILFDDADGVVGARENFRQLSLQHNSISGAVTLKHVIQGQNDTSGTLRMIRNQLNESADANSQEFRKLQEGVDVVVKDVSERKDKEAKVESLRKLRGKLGLSEPVERTESPLVQFRDRIIDGTGSWLDDMQPYKKWIDLKDYEQKVLILKGKSSSGRSFLLAKIHDELEKLPDKNIRLSLLAYTFETDEKAVGSKANQTTQVIQALKQIAVQLAGTDEVYLKLLSTHLDKVKGQGIAKDAAADAKDIRDSKKQLTQRNLEMSKVLADLFSRNTMRSPSTNHYVLLLDGLDQLSYDVAEQLFTSLLRIETDQLKIVLTATPDTVNKILMQTPKQRKTHYTIIGIEDNNHDDICRFVKHEIYDLRRFVKQEIDDDSSASKNSAMKTLIHELEGKVPDLALGSYRNATLIIENVREAVESDKDLEQILDLISAKTLHNPNLMCQKAIRELELSLSSQEIEQLNELLSWTIYGSEYFTIPEMRAALYLLMKKTMFTNLREKVNVKFSKLLTITQSGYFYPKEPEMTDYFNNMPRLKQLTVGEPGTDEPKISMQITITNAKVSQVQRFFWDLSEKIVLNKMDQFTFTNLNMDLEKNVKGSIISASPIDGHLAILRGCFDLLLREENEETEILTSYATGNALQHLPEFETDEHKAALTTEEKQYLVEQLISLLEHPDNIEAHLTKSLFDRGHLLNLSALSKVEQFLSDPVATSKLRVREQRWVKAVLAAGIKSALKGIAKIVARLWLCDRTWDAHLPYTWLGQYLYLETFENETNDAAADDIIFESTEAENDAEKINEGNANSSPTHGSGQSILAREEKSKMDAKRKDDFAVPDNAESDVQADTKADIVEGRDGSVAINSGDTTSRQSPTPADENGPSRDVSDGDPKPYDGVASVLKMVEDELEINKSDSLWYERLGFTYLAEEACSTSELIATAGKEAFLTAKSKSGPSWRLSEGLAQVRYIAQDIQGAIGDMEIALQLLRSIAKRSDVEEKRLLQDRLIIAGWLIELEQEQQAVKILEEIVEEQPDTMEGHQTLFKTLCSAGLGSKAADFLQKMTDRQWKNSKLNEFGHFLLSFCSEHDCTESLPRVLSLAKDEKVLDLVLRTLNAVHGHLSEKEISEETVEELQPISWLYGIALARYNRSKENVELALPYLRQSMELGFGDDQTYSQNTTALDATKCYFSCAFSRIADPDDVLPESPANRSEIASILQKNCDNSWYAMKLRRMLATHHYHCGMKAEADRLIRLELQNAFGLLDDRDPDNDDVGYAWLGWTLLRAGDDLNAMSAISLRIRCYREAIGEGDDDDRCPFNCDGDCAVSTIFPWSATFWVCRICDDVGFCPPCLGKLRCGTLKKPVCSQDHEWLSMGSWKSEYELTGKDKIRMGGTLPLADSQCQEGTRIGGEIVPIPQWLDAIRSQWGIAKPPPWPYTTLNFEKETVFQAEYGDIFLVADFTSSSKDDLVLIRTARNENARIQIAYATSEYQQIDYEQKTVFRSGEGGTWSMLPSVNRGRPDLYLIKSKNTPSGKVELHMASGASNYQERVAKLSTFKCENSGTWAMCDFTGNRLHDLAFIKTSETGSNYVEEHVASAKSNYQEYIYQQPTMFGEGLDKGTWMLRPWSQGRYQPPDLVLILAKADTGTEKAELSVSQAPDYSWPIFYGDTVFEFNNGHVWTMSASKAEKPDLICIQTVARSGTENVKICRANG